MQAFLAISSAVFEPIETRLRGVVTAADGAVHVIAPTNECVEILIYGGGISREVWHRSGLRKWAALDLKIDRATWWRWCVFGMPIDIALRWEATKFLRNPAWRCDLGDRERQDLAARWILALHQGGLTERQAVELICEVSRAAHTTALDIVDVSEIPTDRARRNQWRRSTNGGPIIVPDEDIAA